MRTRSARQSGIIWVSILGAASGALYLAVHGVQQQWDTALRVYPQHLQSPFVPYVLATVALFILYGGLLVSCTRGYIATSGARVLAVGFPVVFNLMFLFSPPTFSGDVLSYIAHGYIASELRGNPYRQPEAAVLGTPIERDLAAHRWEPGQPVSPYGPLWTTIEATVVGSTERIQTQIFALKALAVVAGFGTAAMIWIGSAYSTPELRLLGTLAFLWNPTIIVELAGEGHNDGLMGLFVVLAIVCALRRRQGGAVMALAGGILTKYLPLLFVPLFAAHWWGTGEQRRWPQSELLVGAAAAASISFLLFLPWWAGLPTFDGIRITGAGDTGSTTTIVLQLMGRILGRPVPPDLLSVATLLMAIAIVGFIGRSCSTDRALVRGCTRLSLVYVLLLSPKYWSWYVTVPIALLAMEPRFSSLVLILALSVGSRLTAPLVLLFGSGEIARSSFLLGTWLLGSGLPLLVVAGCFYAWIRGRHLNEHGVARGLSTGGLPAA